jgi:hypothetical protein
MSERVRTTVSVDPDVLEVFRVMAEVAGVSVSRCMGDWLADTADGALLVSQKMREARQSPSLVLRELQGMTKGIADQVDGVLDGIRSKSLGRVGQAPSAPAGRKPAPSSNTGRKSPRRGGSRS